MVHGAGFGLRIDFGLRYKDPDAVEGARFCEEVFGVGASGLGVGSGCAWREWWHRMGGAFRL